MRKCILFLSFIALAACGNKKPQNDPPENQDTIKKEPVTEDKSYLKKRPEEFQDFFKLSSTQPFIGRVATAKDLQEGTAAFVLNTDDPSHVPCEIILPFFAFRNQNDKPVFVVVMQAEVLKGDTMLGYRQGNGLYGMCRTKELEYFEGDREVIFRKSPPVQ